MNICILETGALSSGPKTYPIPDSIPLLPKGIARRQAFIRIKLNYYLYEYRTYGCNYSLFIYFEGATKTLNIEWLSKYFKIEPKDELVLSILRRNYR
jgi:hypothetical protein